MVAEMVDAVIGIDTHRDNHEVEIADPRRTPIATLRISNDSAGFTQLLAALAGLAPGPRAAVSLEGQPQLRDRAGPGANRRRSAGHRV